jgi:hypothetical protein
MSTTTRIRDSVYAELLARSLPRPIRTEAEHTRLTASLLALDEREDLSPEEEALAEVLSGRRSISKAQAKRLAEFFHVPIDLFP